MRIKPEQLNTNLAKGLKPLYCVYGDEPLLVIEAADQIRHWLLYTADAADDSLRVGLGGRPVAKKKSAAGLR